MDIVNATVALTGAASGIGRELAIQLSEAECRLALIDRDESGLVETQSLCRYPTKHSLHIADLSDMAQVNALKPAILLEHPSVEILINNAGVALGGSFEQIDPQDFDWLMNINFNAVVALTRAFLPVFRASEKPAKIVNVSSLYGLISPPNQCAYSASKFAVRGFSNALRHELEGSNISMLVVHPGGVATAISKNAKAPVGADPEEVAKHRKKMQKLLKLPPSKAAAMIVDAIISDKHRVIVGADAKFVSVIERLMPVSYWSLISRLMGR